MHSLRWYAVPQYVQNSQRPAPTTTATAAAATIATTTATSTTTATTTTTTRRLAAATDYSGIWKLAISSIERYTECSWRTHGTLAEEKPKTTLKTENYSKATTPGQWNNLSRLLD